MVINDLARSGSPVPYGGVVCGKLYPRDPLSRN